MDIAGLLAAIDDLRKAVRAVDGSQIQSKALCDKLHVVAETYYANVHGMEAASSEDGEVFGRLHALSRKRPAKRKCLDALVDARKVLVKLEGLSLAQAATKSAGTPTPTDNLIISTLAEICPPAAGSYRQALRDLASPERDSWRGPATDLREALRETLDELAPDKDVERMDGYKPEPDAKRPTMKQKVRFILRTRGMSGSQIAAPENAVKGIEDMLGGLTRSVYTRSNVSTHTLTKKTEVARLHSWVRLVLCELLEVPIH